jgi:hypothetical protein
VGDPATGAFLLSNGFALAGSSYAHTGWAIQEALPDQIAVVDAFATLVGTPSRAIAGGHSLGGIITAGLRFEPAPFLRPFDGFDDHRCDHEHHDSGLCNGEF